jgi:hypothetical protein
VNEIGLPLLWLALLLWPLDIGLRRLHLRLREYFPSRAALRNRSHTGAAPTGPDEAMTRLSAAKRRAQVPSRDIRTVPELRAAPTAAPTPAATPPAKQAPATPTAAPTVAPADNDQLARLLAAKQRARKKRDG